MEEDYTQANRRLMEVFAREPAAAPLMDGVIWQDMAQNCTYRGRAAVAGLLRAFFVEGFPAARAEVQHLLADEETAVLQFTFHGRQDGPFMGIPATGREVSVPMIIVCHIATERIQQAAMYYDAGSLLKQLGMAL